MTDLDIYGLSSLLRAALDSFAQASGSHLRLLSASGEVVCESRRPRAEGKEPRKVSFDLGQQERFVLEGELGHAELRSVAKNLAATVDLHSELATAQNDLGRTREELALIFELSHTLSRVTSAQDVVDRFLAELVNVLDAKEGTYLALDEERQELSILCHFGTTARAVAEFRLRVGEGVAGRVAQDGEPRIINDTSSCPYYIEGGNPVTNIIAAPMRVGGRIVGVVSISDRQGGEPFTLGHLHLLSSLARLGEVGLENARLYEQVRGLLFDSVEALVGVMESRSPDTAGHSRRVARIAYSVGRHMGLSVLQRERLYLAALIHDVGTILLGGEDEKTVRTAAFETDRFEDQADINPAILRSVERLSQSLPGVVQHHEHWDGSGFPKGLEGDAISLQGRIIAVANQFDKLTHLGSTSSAPFRPAEARARVVAQAGARFDPRVIEVFDKVYKILRLETSVPPEADDEPWDSSGGVFTDWT